MSRPSLLLRSNRAGGSRDLEYMNTRHGRRLTLDELPQRRHLDTILQNVSDKFHFKKQEYQTITPTPVSSLIRREKEEQSKNKYKQKPTIFSTPASLQRWGQFKSVDKLRPHVQKNNSENLKHIFGNPFTTSSTLKSNRFTPSSKRNLSSIRLL